MKGVHTTKTIPGATLHPALSHPPKLNRFLPNYFKGFDIRDKHRDFNDNPVMVISAQQKDSYLDDGEETARRA